MPCVGRISVCIESHFSTLFSQSQSRQILTPFQTQSSLYLKWTKEKPREKNGNRTNEGQWEQNFGICILHRYNFTNKCTTITSSINSWYETVGSQLRMLVGEGWVGSFFFSSFSFFCDSMEELWAAAAAVAVAEFFSMRSTRTPLRCGGRNPSNPSSPCLLSGGWRCLCCSPSSSCARSLCGGEAGEVTEGVGRVGDG